MKRTRERKVNFRNSAVTTENLVERCFASGFKGVPALAKYIGRDPKTVWRAVRWPDQFGPTFRLTQEALSE